MYAAHPSYYAHSAAPGSLPGVLQPGGFVGFSPHPQQQHMAAAAMMQQQQQQQQQMQQQHAMMQHALQQQQQAGYPGSLYSPYPHLQQPQPAFLSSPALQLQQAPPQQPLPFAVQMSQMVQPQPPQQIVRVPSLKAAVLTAASPAQPPPAVLSSSPQPLASAGPPPSSSAASAASSPMTLKPQYTVPPHLRPHPPAFPLPLPPSGAVPSSPPAASSAASAASSPAPAKDSQQAISLTASPHSNSATSSSSSPPNGMRKLRARSRDSEREGDRWRRSSSRERNGHTAASSSSSSQGEVELFSSAPPLRHPPLLHAHSAHVASSHHKASLSSLLSSSSSRVPPLTQMQSLPVTASRPAVSWREYDLDWTLEEREAFREKLGRMLSAYCPSYDSLLSLAAAVDEEAIYFAASSNLDYRKMGVELEGWIAGDLRQRREQEREEKDEQDRAANSDALDDGAGLQASADGLLALAQLSQATAVSANGPKAEAADMTEQESAVGSRDSDRPASSAVSRGRQQRQAVSKAALSRRTTRADRSPRAELRAS